PSSSTPLAVESWTRTPCSPHFAPAARAARSSTFFPPSRRARVRCSRSPTCSRRRTSAPRPRTRSAVRARRPPTSGSRRWERRRARGERPGGLPGRSGADALGSALMSPLLFGAAALALAVWAHRTSHALDARGARRALVAFAIGAVLLRNGTRLAFATSPAWFVALAFVAIAT